MLQIMLPGWWIDCGLHKASIKGLSGEGSLWKETYQFLLIKDEHVLIVQRHLHISI